MTKYEEAFKQAQNELNNADLEFLRGEFKKLLQTIEEKKQEKERVEEELRILKLDLEDLKLGKLDKIKERQEKSPVAKNVSPVNNYVFQPVYYRYFAHLTPIVDPWYGGTYNVTLNTVTSGAGSMADGCCNAVQANTSAEIVNKTFYF
jgi:hypothetical protein